MEFQEQVEEIVSTAKFGDLIEFSYPIGYSHWGVYDGEGNVVHFAVADEGKLMRNFRNYLQTAFPVCGDLLLGETKIRSVPLAEVNVPKGVHIMIGNDRHACRPSSEEDIKERRDALLDKEFPYELFSFNCEHFATFVRYGQAVCNQIPGRPKDKECVKTTETFQDIVISRSISRELFNY